MAKRWRIHSHDDDLITGLQQAAGIPFVVAQLLVSRGISDPDQARRFLDTDLNDLVPPERLGGAMAAAERLAAAIADERKIVVYGDYDADGMTGTAILLLCLKLLGAKVDYYVPSRMDEGYGLNNAALETLADQGTQLLITVDCGITSVAEAEKARQLGLELIITDHHQMGERLPPADVLVHPMLASHDYPFDGLCGAGVAFKVAWALCQTISQAKKVSESMRQFLLKALGLASLGTVADVVPLVSENRILVHHGLTSLKKCPTPGIAALAKVTQLDQKPALESEDIAFTIAPRLNAAGRLGQAQLGVELLTTPSAERAMQLAEYIHQLNGTRETLERSIYLAANRQIQERFDPPGDGALVLAGRGWHPGVIGIVAGRLAEKHHCPVILIAMDKLGVKPATGSARSVLGFDLHAALTACSELLISFGGHRAAGGLTIADENVDALRAAFCEYTSSSISADDKVADLWIDAETPFSCLTMNCVDQIQRLAPFGHGNRRPMLCASDVSVAGPPKRIGGGGRHLSVMLSQHGKRLRSVAFGAGERADELIEPQSPLAFAYQPVINTFRGRRSVELHLADWRVESR